MLKRRPGESAAQCSNSAVAQSSGCATLLAASRACLFTTASQPMAEPSIASAPARLAACGWRASLIIVTARPISIPHPSAFAARRQAVRTGRAYFWGGVPCRPTGQGIGRVSIRGREIMGHYSEHTRLPRRNSLTSRQDASEIRTAGPAAGVAVADKLYALRRRNVRLPHRPKTKAAPRASAVVGGQGAAQVWLALFRRLLWTRIG